MSIHPGHHVHLELKADSFVLYTDGSQQRLEVPYAYADEVIEQLTRVIDSEGWLNTELRQGTPSQPSGVGHVPTEARRKMRPVSKRHKMRPICQSCDLAIVDNPQVVDLARREFGVQLCYDCYRNRKTGRGTTHRKRTF